MSNLTAETDPSSSLAAPATPVVVSPAPANDPAPADTTTDLLGVALIGVGVLALLTATFLQRATSGGIAAAALFTVIIGLAVRFPTMLQDGGRTEAGQPAYSSTRVVMLLVVSTFVLLTVKVGWQTSGLDLLKIDPSWAWILGVVLTGKVAQAFSEASGGGAGRK